MTASMDRLADVVSIVEPLAAPTCACGVCRSGRAVRAGALRKIFGLGERSSSIPHG